MRVFRMQGCPWHMLGSTVIRSIKLLMLNSTPLNKYHIITTKSTSMNNSKLWSFINLVIESDRLCEDAWMRLGRPSEIATPCSSFHTPQGGLHFTLYTASQGKRGKLRSLMRRIVNGLTMFLFSKVERQKTKQGRCRRNQGGHRSRKRHGLEHRSDGFHLQFRLPER
jgi:hypothetical protein